MLLEGISLAAEESYQLFFEHSPQPMWVFDLETLSFLAVNNAAVEAYGYSKDEFLSMTIKDIRLSKEIPFLLDQLSIDDSSNRQNIWSHKKKGGEIIVVLFTANSNEFDGRRANLVLCTNVTERMRAEEELSFQKMILEAQSEASIDGILVVSKE